MAERRVSRARYPIHIESRDFGFCVARAGWIQDPAMIAESIDLACTIGAAVPNAVHAANRSAGGVGQVLQQVRAREVAQLTDAQAAVAARNRKVIIAAVISMAVVIAASIAIPLALGLFDSTGSDFQGN